MHRVCALYPTREEAEAVKQRLIANGIAAGAIDVLHEHPMTAVIEKSSDTALKDMLIDGAVGTAVGTGVGVVGTLMLWASGVTLFVASPVIAPLAMLGWFAGLGGLVGAAAGAEPEGAAPRKEGKLSELVMDAIKAGNTVLVARIGDEREQELAKQIVGESLKGRDEAAVASD